MSSIPLAIYPSDTEFQSHVVESVERCDGGFLIRFEDCLHLFVTSEHCSVQPQKGEPAKLYGKGFGYQVRGVVIGDRVYRYRTSEQAEQDRDEENRRKQEKRLQELNLKRPEYARRIAALPLPLQKRLFWFQHTVLPLPMQLRERLEWRRDHEAYELFVCEQAAIVAKWMAEREPVFPPTAKSVDDRAEVIKAMARELRDDFDLAKRIGMDPDHSGNTMSAAIYLGAALHNGESADAPPIWKHHGALCPLAGCDDYGCFAGRQEDVVIGYFTPTFYSDFVHLHEANLAAGKAANEGR